MKKYFYVIFCVYPVDGYFEIGANFLGRYFLNKLVLWMGFKKKLRVFCMDSKKNFISNLQFGWIMSKNFVKNQPFAQSSLAYPTNGHNFHQNLAFDGEMCFRSDIVVIVVMKEHRIVVRARIGQNMD